MRITVAIIALVLVGCGDVQSDPVYKKAVAERAAAIHESTMLKAELDLRRKPEADAIKMLQDENARISAVAAEDRAKLLQQLDILGKQQVLEELAPMQAFVKKTREDMVKTREAALLLAKDVQAMARALQNHVSSEEAQKALDDALDIINSAQ